MLERTRILIASAVLASTLPAAHAQTYRCDRGVVAGGDSKPEVVQRCGQPQSQDSFCEPIATQPQYDARGVAIVAAPQCETVDRWTFSAGSGSLLTTLEFRRGKLTSITTGNRADRATSAASRSRAASNVTAVLQADAGNQAAA